MSDSTDTHRRARLRGREAVARWRIESASWVGWLFAVNSLVGLLVGIASRTRQGLAASAGIVGVTAVLVYGIHRMRQGSRVAACAVVAAVLLMTLASGIDLFNAIVLALLVNGAWGVFQLARVRRDAAHVPPPEVREVRVRVARAVSRQHDR